MNPLEYAPRDSARLRSAPVRFLVRHNPFYLLSAMCMLAGCLALTNSLSWTSIGLGRLLALVVTLNFYEALLLGLGLYLLARRGVVRDGLVLLVLEALFLVDAAFLNVEVFALDPRVGLVTNAAVYVLALVKLCLVFWGLGIRPDRTFAFVLIQVTLLFLLPGIFAAGARKADGWLPPSVAYAAWWAVGTAAALSALMLRPSHPDDQYVLGRTHHRVGTVVRRVFVGLPFASLLAHLVMLHWVYNAHVYSAYLSPLLLGLAVALGQATPSRVLKRHDIALLRAALPALAVFLSFDPPYALRLEPLGESARFAVTPVLLALAGAYVSYVYLYLYRYAGYYLAGGGLALLTYAFGPTPSQVAAGAEGTADWTLGMVRKVIPQTTAGWGATAVGAAFAFLGVGAYISLKKPPATEEGAAPGSAAGAGAPESLG
jgi:hypothetical protein